MKNGICSIIVELTFISLCGLNPDLFGQLFSFKGSIDSRRAI
jgi:hypothetical protein